MRVYTLWSQTIPQHAQAHVGQQEQQAREQAVLDMVACLRHNRNSKFTIKAQYTADLDLPEGCPHDLGSWEIGPPAVPPPSGENAKIKVCGHSVLLL